jgi:hypothetical protein
VNTLALAAGGVALMSVVATGTAYADAGDLLGGGSGGGDSSASGGDHAGDHASGGDIGDSPDASHAYDGAPAGVPVAGTAKAAVSGAQSMVPGGNTGAPSGGY